MNLDKTNQVVEASASFCKEMTKKFDKLINDARYFMRTFHNSFETNTANANTLISSLGSALHTEKDKLEEVGTGIQFDNSELNSSISSKIDKLHEDLEMENKIMDQMIVKTENVKVLTVKMEQAEKQINTLLFEKVVMKSCVADVNALLSDIIENRDSLITITIKSI
ncbi:unnamed protein product [Lactuca saligna]|uniref:Uncharacterized protein n=1 Tax=Lactuca saligna TaxID=75948 RepID=A0AA35ZUP2_LACSI|nr:unnamed protein product [Lactuca saligna]